MYLKIEDIKKLIKLLYDSRRYCVNIKHRQKLTQQIYLLKQKIKQIEDEFNGVGYDQNI